MNQYGTLPVTGASLTLGGVMLDQVWLLGFGMGIVVLGAVAIRTSWRRGKGVTEL